MLSRILLYAIWWGLLLLPASILLLSWLRSVHRPNEAEGGAIDIARWLGLICCSAPILATIRLAIYSTSSQREASVLYLFFLVVGLLTALPAALLFALHARGAERIAGSLACCIAGLMSFVVFVGGTVAP